MILRITYLRFKSSSDLKRSNEMKSIRNKNTISKRTATILFADVAGFSKLTEFQLGHYVDSVMSLIAEEFANHETSVDQVNTWGDGIVAFFRTPTTAVHCALAIRDRFRNHSWRQVGLPELQIRISLHVGEVFSCENPITKRKEFIGTEVNRTARLEPVTIPNHVYVTKEVVELTRRETHGFRFDLIGEMALAKNWPAEIIFVCSREGDAIDVKALTPPDRRLQSFLGVSDSSSFGKQLCLSSHAKAALGAYCVESGFWRHDEVLFLESGTIPVYLFHSLCASSELTPKPSTIVTNNIACSSVLLRTREHTSQKEIYPLDDKLALLLIGGRVFDDYSAILPEFVVSDPNPTEADCRAFLSFLCAQRVERILMMISSIKASAGPCAVSTPMRRFKKLLLRYIHENHGATLEIFAEADKLLDRPGRPIDSVHLGVDPNVRYWEDLAKSGRVSITVAVSPHLNESDAAAIRKEAIALSASGVRVTLIDANGRGVGFQQ